MLSERFESQLRDIDKYISKFDPLNHPLLVNIPRISIENPIPLSPVTMSPPDVNSNATRIPIQLCPTQILPKWTQKKKKKGNKIGG